MFLAIVYSLLAHIILARNRLLCLFYSMFYLLTLTDSVQESDPMYRVNVICEWIGWPAKKSAMLHTFTLFIEASHKHSESRIAVGKTGSHLQSKLVLKEAV